MEKLFRQGDIVLFQLPEGSAVTGRHLGVVLQDSPKMVHIILLIRIQPGRLQRPGFAVVFQGDEPPYPIEIAYNFHFTINKEDVLAKKGKLHSSSLYQFAKEYTYHLFPFLRDEVIHRLERAIINFETLLIKNSDEIESVFHNFLHKNPILLDPVGFVHNKPSFKYPVGKTSRTGKGELEPDFIVSYSTQHYRLIEIERPNKNFSTGQGQQRATVTQAAYQLTEWKHFLDHHASEVEATFPGISDKANRSFSLIIGRTHDLGPYANFDDLRTSLKEANNCDVLSYDDLLQRAKDYYENLKAI
ncbi:Shedu anti-phage system protein SduA domain-containing protein (plasmid) [Paenibacillus sp. RS8]|uniref:Shedu anti-phage system protein SduA domain-containing protein n=1 Tax=Paenibacillus sp. RS8 TaxID=3242681 RepID=UPI0035BFFD77